MEYAKIYEAFVYYCNFLRLSVVSAPVSRQSLRITYIVSMQAKTKKIPHNTMIYDAIPYKIQGNLTNFTQQFMSSLFIYVVIYLFVCYRYIIYPACLAHSASLRGSRHIPSSANSESKIYFTATHIRGGVKNIFDNLHFLLYHIIQSICHVYVSFQEASIP